MRSTSSLASAGALRIAAEHQLIYNILAVLTGSFLIAAFAQLEFRIPISPVPITGQTFAVLVVGMALGAVRGGIAVLAYLLEGAAGMPVFAGGAAGIIHLFGPSGGYLIGFVFAASAAGYLAEKGWDRHLFSTLPAMVIGTSMIFLSGLLWLSLYFPLRQLPMIGLYPFIPGAIIKITAAAVLLPSLRKLI